MHSQTSITLIASTLALLGAVWLATPADAAPVPQVQVCHFPPSNPDNFHTITVRENALSAHLAHGDLTGACNSICAEICDDGDACTIDDMADCEYNGCPVGRDPVNCNDGLGCTIDSCDAATGCLNEAIVCNPPDLCTVSACAEPEGVCMDTAVTCPAGQGQECNPANGVCEEATCPCEAQIALPDYACPGTTVLSKGCTDFGNPGVVLSVAVQCNDFPPGSDDATTNGSVCAVASGSLQIINTPVTAGQNAACIDLIAQLGASLGLTCP
jgi:hypothetical protein